MRYLAYTKKAFINNGVYRFDHFMGIFNTCLQIFIFWNIYKALYGSALSVDGITLSMVTTHFILSLGLSSAFSINEDFLPRKINSGNIGNELLKPISIRGMMLAEDVGNICFKMIFRFVPALGIAIFTVGILKPATMLNMLGFIVSIGLGFMILWCIGFIVQTTAFWLINVWSIRTIKNVLVNILSGALFPLWFMPQWMAKIIDCTPFSSIYFTPVQIYLGQISGTQMINTYIRQLFWILLLLLIGECLWKKGIKKLVIQGG
jgi:ABC-2 type transport system permease protein